VSPVSSAHLFFHNLEYQVFLVSGREKSPVTVRCKPARLRLESPIEMSSSHAFQGFAPLHFSGSSGFSDEDDLLVFVSSAHDLRFPVVLFYEEMGFFPLFGAKKPP